MYRKYTLRSVPYALTPRQLEILELFAKGKCFKEIAQQLFLSLKTVETHWSNIKQAFGTHTMLETLIHAFKTGAVPCPCSQHVQYIPAKVVVYGHDGTAFSFSPVTERMAEQERERLEHSLPRPVVEAVGGDGAESSYDLALRLQQSSGGTGTA